MCFLFRLVLCDCLLPTMVLLMAEIRLTTKDDDYPIIYKVSTIPGGAGFQPSTVCHHYITLWEMFLKLFPIIEEAHPSLIDRRHDSQPVPKNVVPTCGLCGCIS